MQLTEKIEYFTQLWCVVLPHVREPSPQDVARWCDYESAIVERAILRTGRRFAENKVQRDFDPTQAYRYTTGVARSMTTEQLMNGLDEAA